MGIAGISKSQVSRLCEEIDDRVNGFLNRPIEADLLAYMAFPAVHRAKLHSVNPLERLNGEIKRRTDPSSFCSPRSAPTRRVMAASLGKMSKTSIQRARCMTLETIATLGDEPAVSLPVLAT